MTQQTYNSLKLSQPYPPPELMDMILLAARAYSIKFVATRKKVEKEESQELNSRLEDAVRLLELDKGESQQHTNELMDNVNTLKNTIHARNEYEEEERARKFMHSD